MNIDFDPLSLSPSELSDSLPHAFDYMNETPTGVVFTGYHFFRYLNKAPKTHLWVMTYTYKPSNTLLLPVKRLLYSIGTSFGNTKQLLGIHTKLYIQFLDRKIVGVYLGSQNLVRPTNANLMIKVPTKHHKFFKDYFLHFWNQA